MRLAMKFLVVSSSGRMRNMAEGSRTKASASRELSKQRTCSISESRNTFSRDMAVESTEAMA